MVQKELKKLSQSFWKGFLKCYDGGGENEITSKKKILKLKCFSMVQRVKKTFSMILEGVFEML
jgi:hypothetical protein